MIMKVIKGRGKSINKSKNPSWSELPEELWENILIRLATIERLLIAIKVCATWKRVLHEPSMWHIIDMSNCRGLTHSFEFRNVCHHALNLSQGELVDIRFTFYATKGLLLYVAERSPKLKRLSIAWCYSKLAPKDLIGVVEKLPMLEELSLTYVDITTEVIETLGRSCPHLKSFELKTICCSMKSSNQRNVDALAISKSLPVLRQLQLINNSMTKVGLLAILDGCPNLESLDLRGCFNVSLDKVLSCRISQQIKHLNHPHDSQVVYFF